MANNTATHICSFLLAPLFLRVFAGQNVGGLLAGRGVQCVQISVGRLMKRVLWLHNHFFAAASHICDFPLARDFSQSPRDGEYVYG